MTKRFTVTWAGGSVEVEAGTLLSRALNSRGPIVETPCGGRGYCVKCLVRVVSGDAPPSKEDLARLSLPRIEEGFRLSCRLPVESDLRVSVPAAGDRGVYRVSQARGSAGAAHATGRSLGFALDLGTTGMAGSLLDLDTGERVSSGTCPNPQARHGADVISRLAFALKSRENALTLREEALGAARGLMRSLCEVVPTLLSRVSSGAVVGNTAMHHLLLGLDVSSLSRAPYVPASRQATTLDVPGLPPMYAVPVIAGFVGSDSVAGAVSTGLLGGGKAPRLLIDLGTNSEVLLWTGDRLMVASAPAGPAFEGGEISQGMLAVPGAIQSVRADRESGELDVSTIDDAPARGICGSGLIDAVAALLETGILDRGGLIRSGASSAAITPRVSLTQKDIRAFQLAKGAVRAAVDSLLDDAGLPYSAVSEILLAGAFGARVNPDSAVFTGLLPPVSPGVVRPVGNTALAGAEMVLLSPDAMREAEDIADRATHLELALRPSFQEMFLEAVQFRMP